MGCCFSMRCVMGMSAFLAIPIFHRDCFALQYRYPSASELKIICSPVLYDEALRSAREWTRMGHSAKEIQDEIDANVEHLTEVGLPKGYCFHALIVDSPLLRIADGSTPFHH